MCGRFTLRVDLRSVVERFRLHDPAQLDWEPRFNIAPTQTILAVRRNAAGERELVGLRWGLIPSWAKDAAIGNRLINARAETVSEKPAFRAAYARRRCLVPADGYYEWMRGEKGQKQPYWIGLRDQPLFAIAGLWETWRDPKGARIESVTLLTTAANGATRSIHPRMPVILRPGLEPTWLGETDATRDELSACLMPYRSAAMNFFPVSSYVSRPQNEGPQCVAPAPGELERGVGAGPSK